MKRSPNTEFFEDGLKSGTFWKRRFPVLVWTPIFLKTETCEQGLNHVCRFLLLKMFQKFLFFCDLPRAFLDRVGKLLKLIFRHYSQIFRHYVCVITPKLSTCIFRWLSSFIVVSFEGVLHSEVTFTPNFSFGSILCSAEFCIRANFAFWRVLHSSMPYSLANLNTRDVQRLYVLKWRIWKERQIGAVALSHLNRL